MRTQICRTASPFAHFINDLLETTAGEANRLAPRNWPLVDIVESDEGWNLYAELPGVDKSEVKTRVEDGVLFISGEKKARSFDQEKYRYFETRSGSFERKFALPDAADTDALSATMNNGLLQVVVGRKEESKPKEITINIQ